MLSPSLILSGRGKGKVFSGTLFRASQSMCSSLILFYLFAVNNLLDSVLLCDIYGVNTRWDEYGTERTETAGVLTYFLLALKQTGVFGC